MPTWTEVQKYAREKYALTADTENSFRLTFEYQNDRLQAVVVSRFEAMGREWVDFASACAKREDLAPADALRRNYGFAVGALCLDPDEDVYVVRYSVQLDTMDLDEFELPLHVVARTADKLEQEITGKDVF